MKTKIKLLHLTVMFLLSIIVLLALILEMFFPIEANLRAILHQLSMIILVVFTLDFAFFFLRSKDKSEFLKENWYSVLVLIPPLKILKGLKLFKAIKGLKFYKSFKLGKKLKKSKKQNLNP